MEKLKTVIDELLDCCNEWDEDMSYDRGYKDGFHDALLDVLNRMEIDTDEEYRD